MKKLTILTVLFLGALISCVTETPLKAGPSDNNETYNIEYLFEHDGCKVYRFLDKGNYVYFTNCKGDVTSFENDSTDTRIENHIDVSVEE